MATHYLDITSDRCFKNLIYKVPEVLSIIYQAVTGIESSSFRFQNIEILSPSYDGKMTKRDIFVEDEYHNFINLEMQNELCERMQFYCNQLIQLQAKKGTDYNFKTPYIICIVNDETDQVEELIEYYKVRREDNQAIKENMTNIIFIHLSCINKLAKKKKLFDFNTFERILYAL